MLAIPPGLQEMAKKPFRTPILRLPSGSIPYNSNPPQAPEAVDGVEVPQAPVGNDLPNNILPTLMSLMRKKNLSNSISTVAKTALEPPNTALSLIAHGKEDTIKTIPNISSYKGKPINASIMKTNRDKFRVLLHGEDSSFIDAGALLRKEGDGYVIENIANNETIHNAIPTLRSLIVKNIGKIIRDKNAPRLRKQT